MTGPREDDAHEDEDAVDESSLPEDVRERVRRMRESLAKQQVQSVGVFDQFLAGLLDLEHTMDEVADLELPQGQRLELVRALSNLMKSAVLGLEREWDLPTDPGDVYGQALDVIDDLRSYVEERRLETRAKNLASELGTDDTWQALHRVATHPTRLQELVGEAGWDPPDETIKAWLLRNAPKHREEP